jgi:RimJ/RimL family protein N-acetyltransferase
VEPVRLRSARLELSLPGRDDIDAIFLACQDADIQRYTTVPSPYLRVHAEQFASSAAGRWTDGVNLDWAIRYEGALAGMIGLYRVGGGSAELGYWLVRSHRGRGLLTEAAGAVIEWGFADDGLAAERIEWRAVVGNVASARVARALGFRYEGTLRGALANTLGRDDGWVAGMLRTDDRAPAPWPVLAG